jgi:hypothetical protein
MMLRAAPGEPLSFEGKTFEEEDQPMVAGQVAEVVELYQTTSTKKRKADMKTLKEQIQAKLAEKKLKKGQAIPSRPPLYDEVFFEGVKWLDSLAGEPVEPQEGEITFYRFWYAVANRYSAKIDGPRGTFSFIVEEEGFQVDVRAR